MNPLALGHTYRLQQQRVHRGLVHLHGGRPGGDQERVGTRVRHRVRPPELRHHGPARARVVPVQRRCDRQRGVRDVLDSGYGVHIKTGGAGRGGYKHRNATNHPSLVLQITEEQKKGRNQKIITHQTRRGS
jgi:hypothetical protein